MEINTIQQTSRQYFKSLQIIHITLIAGQLIFGLIVAYMLEVQKINFGMQDLKIIFYVIVPVFAVASYAGGSFFIKTRLKTTKNLKSLASKMNDYRTVLIMQYAILEGPSFLSLTVYLLTGDLFFTGITGLIIMVLIILRPKSEKAISDLELNPSESTKISDPDTIITDTPNHGQ
jgi:uncharacterized membrane protein